MLLYSKLDISARISLKDTRIDCKSISRICRCFYNIYFLFLEAVFATKIKVKGDILDVM